MKTNSTLFIDERGKRWQKDKLMKKNVLMENPKTATRTCARRMFVWEGRGDYFCRTWIRSISVKLGYVESQGRMIFPHKELIIFLEPASLLNVNFSVFSAWKVPMQLLVEQRNRSFSPRNRKYPFSPFLTRIKILFSNNWTLPENLRRVF